MSDQQAIIDVLAAHWSFTTDSEQRPFVDRCDGCGEAVFVWGAGDQRWAWASHQAAKMEPVAQNAQEAWRERGPDARRPEVEAW